MFWLQYFANCRLFSVKIVGIREALLNLVVCGQLLINISTNHGLNTQYVKGALATILTQKNVCFGNW